MAQKRPLDSLSNRSRRPATPPVPDDAFFDDLPKRATRARTPRKRNRVFLWWILFFLSLGGLVALLLPLAGIDLIPSASAPAQQANPSPSPLPSSAPSPSPTPTPTPEPTPTPQAVSPTRVRVLNGTGEAGLAASAAAKLTPLGWSITTGNARASTYTATSIYYRDAALLTAAQTARTTLGYQSVTIEESTLAAAGELLIVVGRNR